MVTMWPWFFSIILGKKALHNLNKSEKLTNGPAFSAQDGEWGALTQKWAKVLTWNVFSMAASVDSRNFLPVTIPALFTRMSMSPTFLLI